MSRKTAKISRRKRDGNSHHLLPEGQDQTVRRQSTSAGQSETSSRWLESSGFSLVELLIAAFLSVVISAMMFSVLNNQETAARRNDANAVMQESLRFALQVMSRHVRMAGYGIGFSVIGAEGVEGLGSLEACNNTGGYDCTAETAGVECTDAGTGTDQLFVMYRNPVGEFRLNPKLYQVAPPVCAADNFISDSDVKTKTTFPESSLIVCREDGVTTSQPAAYAWKVSADSTVGDPSSTTGGIVRVNANSSTLYETACPNSEKSFLPVSLTCGGLEGSTISFFVRDETLWMDDNGTALDVNSACPIAPSDDVLSGNAIDDIPLAHHIEDMQIALCIPGYPGPSVDEATVISGLQSCMTDPSSQYWKQPDSSVLTSATLPLVRAVRITLVAKGPLDLTGRGLVSSRPAIEDHAPSDSGDSRAYPRMIQSTIVQVPNLSYWSGLARWETTQWDTD